MPKPIPIPPIDPRSYDQVVSDIETRVSASTGYSPGESPDAGFALIRIFARMASHAIQRLNRSLDRMESQGDDYRERVRKGFLVEAARATEQVHVIDAGQSIEAVHADIWRIAAKLLHLLQ